MDRIGIWLLMVCVVLLGVVAIQPDAQPQRAFQVTTFEVEPPDGGAPALVRVQSTRLVTPDMIELLKRSMSIKRLDRLKPEERSLLVPARGKAAKLDPSRAELLIDVQSKDGAQWAWTWPDAFQIARPGILEVAPVVGGGLRDGLATRRELPDEDIGVIHQALHGGPHHVTGRLVCQAAPVPFIKVVVAGMRSQTGPDGTFSVDGEFPGIPGTVFIAFEGTTHFNGVDVPLQIFDDVHVTRSERVDRMPAFANEIAAFGDIEIPGTDCILWNVGVRSLERYVAIMGAPPPAGNLRIKRWTDVRIDRGAGLHTFYDYIVAPTDTATDRPGAISHEFGHSIAFVADGPKTHWDWDNVRFIYARRHNDRTVSNKALAFIEGWADYWQAATNNATSIGNGSGLTPEFTDFNENLVAGKLMEMAQVAPGQHHFMVQLFLDNPGQLHTLRQYEEHYCAALGTTSNAHCSNGHPTRTTRACPPGYNDDGLTCRLINIVAKSSQGRGVGVVPNNCGAGREYDAGLCYPRCPAGLRGVGPVCWQDCPAGYHDDGATCRRDAHIFGADNSACPWYDKCGLVTARGCSVCPAGYNNDGCTCRRDVDIFAKRSQGRGVGTVPNGCAAGMQADAGLCYHACPAGFNGVGPVCWGQCPTDFADHGATCYREPNVFSDDPVVPP